MRGVIGLDVGGANTKAVWRDGEAARAVSRPFEISRDREALTAVLRDVVAELGADPVELVALTLTAELADAFAGKREGVGFVLDAAAAALGGRARLLVLTTAGDLIAPGEARARPLDVAAANWVASALAVAAVHPDALVLDVGSTTADVIPIAAGGVAAEGRTDLDRLLAGELVYTGALRTSLAAVVRRVPVRGRWCPVAGAAYAITADVHLLLGHIAPADYTCPTPDGRAASVEGARARVARQVCADVEQLEPGATEAIAAHVHSEQVTAIEEAALRVGTRVPAGAAPVAPLGTGAFLARAVAERLGRPVAEMPWSAAERDAGPAAALARLAAARLPLPC
jgi:(4-(4-[2-(gamma-L-glutamylamino)ethyl]phenoxymethyl)furan-2-yl)methanamine synthase